jgi:hypothetical protein
LDPKRDDIIGGWRKLHTVELHKVCSQRNIIRIIKSRRMRWTEHVARTGEEKKNASKFLVEKPEGWRPLGRHRCRWEDNIKSSNFLFLNFLNILQSLNKNLGHEDKINNIQLTNVNIYFCDDLKKIFFHE